MVKDESKLILAQAYIYTGYLHVMGSTRKLSACRICRYHDKAELGPSSEYHGVGGCLGLGLRWC